jgi:hypothetical protein
VITVYLFCSRTTPLSAARGLNQQGNGVSESCKAPSSAEEISETSLFIDKWLINGNAIGNSIGAVVGQSLVGLAFGGPAGLFIGSVIGSTAGGWVGSLIDDRMGVAINYSAFDRPPVTEGGIWLKDVGPWEQAMYQVDALVLNGGNIAGIGSNLIMNIMARTIPGMTMMANPILLTLVGYVTGTVADNIDGMVDLGLIGRQIDNAGDKTIVGADLKELPDKPAEESPDLAAAHENWERSYKEILNDLQHGSLDSIKTAYQDHANVSRQANYHYLINQAKKH